MVEDRFNLYTKLQGKVLEVQSVQGDEAATLSPQGLLESFRSLKEDPELAFNFLMDLTVVDYLGKKSSRFEVVYQLYSLPLNHRLRVKVPLGSENPEIASLTPLWKSADWLEREAWDMFGIRFLGHPDLRRILLYEEFQGHPLRKDYPVNQCQPRVPQREIEGTFVDSASRDKLYHLQQKLAPKN